MIRLFITVMDPFVETIRDVLGPTAKISTTISGVIKVTTAGAIDYKDIQPVIGANDKRLVISSGEQCIQFHTHTGEPLPSNYELESTSDSGPVQIDSFKVVDFITSDDLDAMISKPMVLKLVVTTTTIDVYVIKPSDVVGSLAHLKRRGKVKKTMKRKRRWSDIRQKAVQRKWLRLKLF